MNRKNILVLGLASACSILGYLFASIQLSGIGFPLDDGWIHQTYARNLAELGEWSFIPGQPSAGATAPLWVGLLAAGRLLGSGPFGFTFILGWLCLWGVGVVGLKAAEILLRDKPERAIWAGLGVVFEWHLVWAAVSGMETLLFGLIVLACLVWLWKLNENTPPVVWFWIGIAVGLSIWVRPEGLTLLGPVLLAGILVNATWQKRSQNSARVVAGVLILAIPYLIFNRVLAGAYWPNTFFAKQAEYAIYRQLPMARRLLQQFTLPLIGFGIVVLPGFIANLHRAFHEKRWGVWLSAAWFSGHLILYAIRLPVVYQHGRYAIPAMPVFFLLGIIGVLQSIDARSEFRLKRLGSIFSGALVFAVAAVFWFVGAGAYAEDVGVINTEMVVMAKWVAKNTQPDDLIAAHDIGALGYFARRPLIDLAGLVSAEVIPFIRDENKLSMYLDEVKPKYLLTFPDWYPFLVSKAEFVYATKGEISIQAGGENLHLYLWPETLP